MCCPETYTCMKPRGGDNTLQCVGSTDAIVDPVACEACHTTTFSAITDNQWSQVTWPSPTTGTFTVKLETTAGRWGAWGKDHQWQVKMQRSGSWVDIPGHQASNNAYEAVPQLKSSISIDVAISGIQVRTPTWSQTNSQGIMTVCQVFPNSPAAHAGLVPFQTNHWQQVALKHCGNHLLGPGYSTVNAGYSTVNEAKDACLLSAQCNGVWDERCDNNGSFFMCDKAHKWDDSSASVGSCVYRRPEATTTTEPVRRLAAFSVVDTDFVMV